MAKTKLACSQRCPVAGVVYMPGTVDVDAEVAAELLRCWPAVFAKIGSGTSSVGDGGDVGINADTPAPEKRRRKPARVKRKG